MLLLIVFAFIAGIVTVLSPCILPILPVVLSGSIAGGKHRPLGVVAGFVVSFTLFTLFLSSIVKLFGIPADSLRLFSIVLIFVFGLSLLLPKFQTFLEILFSKLSNLTPKSSSQGFWGGILVGLSIGLIWTPCVGPILASVISLAISGEVTGSAFFITLAYSLGTAIPMLAIVGGGRNLLNRFPLIVQNTANIQKTFGVVMIFTAIAIFFNLDRKFQVFILDKFPNYGTGLTRFEDNESVKKELNELKEQPLGEGSVNLKNLGAAPEIIEGGEWLGSEPLRISQLRGKVVLIDFWTYTCINCIRTLPYLKAWHEKYADDGLVIIGVHTPEFEFEKSLANLQKAVADFEIKYPVIQDNNYETWRAYNNRYWPAKYLIDKNGQIRYTHFGEGAYDETEKVIQELLSEGSDLVTEEIINTEYQVYSRTPELYLGSARMQFLQNSEDFRVGEDTNFVLPPIIKPNYFAFGGNWVIEEEQSKPSAGGVLVLSFESKDTFLVMRTSDEKEGRVKVYIDDVEIGSSFAGDDVQNAVVTVKEDRLYNLVRLPQPGRHTLKLEFLDSNIEVFAFTFG